MAMRRRLGRPVDKAQIVRTLVMLAERDEAVRDALVQALRAQDELDQELGKARP
ncbi:hypothetical protein [Frankia sp. Cr1]|uniref:hypothetical protein n=1 Tax=Frankia sp. Cr1 TaxID=3073931 RepID=UPI002AD3BC4D|nr:hypothetical protein [Frankia sp. Cr1]